MLRLTLASFFGTVVIPDLALAKIRRIDEVIAEIDEDPTCIFFG